jgi:DNA helicase-2/ATP-dependent DNA helicase PcrA
MLPRIGNATAARLWERMAKTANPLKAAMEASLCEGLPASARPYVTRFQHDLRSLKAALEDQPPSSLILTILESGYAEYLRATYDSSASRLEDLQQLAMFARAYRTLRDLLSELVLLGELYGQDMAGGGLSDTERLILSSIHQAKGLEWRVVFVIRMCEGDFPSEMALREEAGEEEERRIFYVATTRAKDELYLSHPLINMGLRGEGSLLLQPSRFLREIRFTLYEQGEVDHAPSSFSESD